MPRPRKITDVQRARIISTALTRMQIPSDKELARECGVSVPAIRRVMEELLAMLPVKKRSVVCIVSTDEQRRNNFSTSGDPASRDETTPAA